MDSLQVYRKYTVKMSDASPTSQVVIPEVDTSVSRDYNLQNIPDTFILPTDFSPSSLLKSDHPPDGRELSLRRCMNVHMSSVQVALACAVIEECIEMLSMMISNCPNVPIKFDFKDCQEKFKLFEEGQTFIRKEKEDLEWHKKLSSDVGLLQKVLRIAQDDLKYDEHIMLHTYLNNEVWKWRSEENLKFWHEHLSVELLNLDSHSKIMKHLADQGRKRFQVGWLRIQELFEETSIKCGVLIDYINKYNQSRIEQNRLMIKMTEEKQIKNALSKGELFTTEKTIHDSIINFCKHSMEQIEKEVAKWRIKLTKDMEEMEFMQNTVNTDVAANAAKLAEMLAFYFVREMNIERYVDNKENLFYLEICEFAMDNLVKYIQCWWRGTMVRWELGPYSQQKPTKGKSDDSNEETTYL